VYQKIKITVLTFRESRKEQILPAEYFWLVIAKKASLRPNPGDRSLEASFGNGQ
jgi:hypothetical protein